MSVRDHLVQHHALTPTSAAELVRRQTAIVQSGMREETSLSDVAGRVLRATGHVCDDKCRPGGTDVGDE
jgi:hypothetical protein